MISISSCCPSVTRPSCKQHAHPEPFTFITMAFQTFYGYRLVSFFTSSGKFSNHQFCSRCFFVVSSTIFSLFSTLFVHLDHPLLEFIVFAMIRRGQCDDVVGVAIYAVNFEFFKKEKKLEVKCGEFVIAREDRQH